MVEKAGEVLVYATPEGRSRASWWWGMASVGCAGLSVAAAVGAVRIGLRIPEGSDFRVLLGGIGISLLAAMVGAALAMVVLGQKSTQSTWALVGLMLNLLWPLEMFILFRVLAG